MNLKSKNFQNAKNIIQSYAQVISDVKGTFSVHQKNWEEYSLKVYAKGLTTTPIPIKRENYYDALDLNINMVEHKLKIFCAGERHSIELVGQTQIEFAKELETILRDLKIDYKISDDKFSSSKLDEYLNESVEEIWAIIREVYFTMMTFKGDKLEETSNINFWPHHFDLAMLMFNGKLISGQEPDNWDYSREQMNYGFSFGDEAITNPYFYITQYPFNDKILEFKLTNDAYWHKTGWKGAVLDIKEYENLSEIHVKAVELYNLVYKYSIKLF